MARTRESRIFGDLILPVGNEFVDHDLIAAQTAVAADPDSAFVISVQRADGIRGQGIGIRVAMSVVPRRACLRIKYVQTMILRACPDQPF